MPSPAGPPVILGIDPGPTHSGYAYIDARTRRPQIAGITENYRLLELIQVNPDWFPHQPVHAAIEMVASYGMPVGTEVFDTCVWIGRYQQALHHAHPRLPVNLVRRNTVKLHHCHSATAGDANITQALRDRFAKGQPNYGKGTKAAPGWFHGFKGDTWQAYALAVYIADQLHPEGRTRTA
jgi:hypothetical protein